MKHKIPAVIAMLMLFNFPLPIYAASGDKKADTPAKHKKKKKQDDVVHIGGMSIIGNRELPKSLYIVPWKDSDVDSETDLSRDLLNERAEVVDQDEFKRQLNYYDLSK